MYSRVVITGVGAVTPKTMGKSLLQELLNAKTSGKKEISKSFGDFLTRAEELIPYNTLRRICRFSALALYSNILAAKDSEIVINEGNSEHIGSIMNTIYGPLKVTEKLLNTLVESGPQNVSPADFANTVINCATGQVSIYLKIKGASSTMVGSSSLTYAYELIRNQKAKALFVSGVEEYHENVEKNYSEKIQFSENSACLVLEDYEHAKARNAKIYAEIIGCGTGTDPEQMERIDVMGGNGLKSAISFAIGSIKEENPEGYLISAVDSELNELYKKEIEIVSSKIKIKDSFSWKNIFGEALGVNEVLAAYIGAIFLNENKFRNNNDNSDAISLGNDALIICNSYQPGGCWSTICMKKVI